MSHIVRCLRRRQSISRSILVGCLVAFFALALGADTFADPSSSIIAALGVTNGQVNATAVYGSTLYVGGSFSSVGDHTGQFAAVDSSTGDPGAFPDVEGSINAIVSDGSGGFYIGGSITSVAGDSVSNIAHINADGSLDTGFLAATASGQVDALALAHGGGTLYVGGSFTTLSGQPNLNFGAIDTTTGVAKHFFADADAPVRAIALSPDDSTIYLGGSFLHVGGDTRAYIAAVESDGTVDAFNPGADDDVFAIALSHDQDLLYVGGQFSTLAGQSRAYFGAVETANGSAAAFDPGAGSPVQAIALSSDSSTIYVGSLTSGLTAFNSDGTARSFSESLSGSATVMALALSSDDSTLYVGGDFTAVNGASGHAYLAAFDTADSSVKPLAANVATATGGVDAIAVSADGDSVAIGGDFTSVGGEPRSGIAAFDLTTGARTSFQPSVDVTVKALAVSSDGSTLYIGGAFNTIDGTARNNLGAVSTTTGNVTSFDPNSNGTVNALALSPDGSTLYVGGGFSFIGGKARTGVVAIDTATGAARSFNATVSGGTTVNALALTSDGSTLYLGGDFTTVGGSSRSDIAAVDASTGAATSFSADANFTVYALALSGDDATLYAGGIFTVLSAVGRSHIGAVDTTSGTPTSFDPEADSIVYSLNVLGTSVFAGGGFTAIGGQPRNSAAELNADGSASAFDPDVSGNSPTVRAATLAGDTYIAGGSFASAGGEPRENLALFPGSTPVTAITSAPVSSSSTSANVGFGATIAGSTFQCKLDFGSYASCTSPVTYNSLSVGSHTVYVRATYNGSTDPNPASTSWQVLAPDGSGGITLSPAGVSASSTAQQLTLQYTAAAGGISNGSLTVAVPNGWPAPSTGSSDPGYTTATRGTVGVSGQTITISALTLQEGQVLQIVYGAGAGVTIPAATGAATFQVQMQSSSGGSLTDVGTSPHITVYAHDGSGTLTSPTTTVSAGQTGRTLTFTYTAPAGGMLSGSVRLTVPTGWSAPIQTTGAAGAVSSNGGPVTIVGRTIRVDSVTLSAGASFAIIYGWRGSGGPGATAGSTVGPQAWASSEQSTPTGAPTALASSPGVHVYAHDGAGTASASIPTVSAAATGKTVVFTYTAPAGGLAAGTVTLVVPTGWSPPSTTGSAAGYTTGSGGTRSVSGQTVTFSNLTMAAGHALKITYGARVSGGPGATVSTGTGAQTWTTRERSTSGGVLTVIGASPQVHVYARDGSGTMSASPTTVQHASAGKTITLTYTAAAGGLFGGRVTVTVPSGWTAPSLSGTSAGFVKASTGTVTLSGRTVVVGNVTLAANSHLTITFGSKASGGPGAKAPGTAVGMQTWPATERSIAAGVVTDLASSPKITIN